jgi:hypothetical protein
MRNKLPNIQYIPARNKYLPNTSSFDMNDFGNEIGLTKQTRYSIQNPFGGFGA